MKFGSWSWRQAAAPEEIKRREREFNFRAKETLSLLFSIIREIRSRSRGCEIDWSSVGRSVKSVTLWLPFRLPRITLSREIKVEFESGDAGNSIKTRSRSRSYPLVAGIKISIHISPVVSILWKRIPICRRKYRSGVARLEGMGKKGKFREEINAGMILKTGRTNGEISRWYFSFVPILFTHEAHTPRGEKVKFYFIVFYRRKFVAQIQFKKVAFPFSKHLKFSIHRSKLSLLQFPHPHPLLLPFGWDVRSLGSEVARFDFFTRGGGSEGVILLRTKDNFIVCIRLKKKKKARESSGGEAREQCRCCKTNAITSRNETNLSRTGKWLASWSNKLRRWGRFSAVTRSLLSTPHFSPSLVRPTIFKFSRGKKKREKLSTKDRRDRREKRKKEKRSFTDRERG